MVDNCYIWVNFWKGKLCSNGLCWGSLWQNPAETNEHGNWFEERNWCSKCCPDTLILKAIACPICGSKQATTLRICLTIWQWTSHFYCHKPPSSQAVPHPKGAFTLTAVGWQADNNWYKTSRQIKAKQGTAAAQTGTQADSARLFFCSESMSQ